MRKYTFIKLDKINSTNIYASSLISQKKAVCDTVVTAKFQNEGKGYGTNQWYSDYGKNVLCSVIVCPDFVKAFDQFRISKITSLAIRDCLKKEGIDSQIKWPNDILVKKKKIAGILIENTIQSDFIPYSIIGIGINVNQNIFEKSYYNATSVFNETSKIHATEKIISNLIDNFDYWYTRLETGDVDDIDKEYLKCLYGLNAFLPFKKGTAEFEAMITGVGEAGELFLRRKDGKILKVYFKEIEYL